MRSPLSCRLYVRGSRDYANSCPDFPPCRHDQPLRIWCNLQVYPEGKMSQCMERLAIGDTLKFKGPRGKFKYQPNMKRAIGKHKQLVVEPTTLSLTWQEQCGKQAEAFGNQRCPDPQRLQHVHPIMTKILQALDSLVEVTCHGLLISRRAHSMVMQA